MDAARGQTTITWGSAATGNWTTATNWSPNTVPSGTSYIAQINAVGSPYTVTLDSSETIAGLTLNSSAATLAMGTNTLTIGNSGTGFAKDFLAPPGGNVPGGL